MKCDSHGRITTLVAAFALVSACGGETIAPDTTPASVVLSPPAGSLVGGGTLQLTAVVKNAGGDVLAGKTVTYASDKPAIATVSATGLATAVGPVGSANLTGSTGAVTSAPTVITVSAAAAQNLAKGTDVPAAPVVGSANAVTVKAADSFGNPVAGIVVTFAATAGGGSVTPTSAATDASGLAGTSFKIGNTVGTNTATATATSLTGSPVTFSAASVAGAAASIVKVGADPASVVAGASYSDSIRVQVTDGSSNAKSGVSVAFAVMAGGGSVTPATVTTGADGKAAAKFITGSSTGANTATATVTGLPAVTFSITTVAPTLVWSSVSSGTTQNIFGIWGTSASDVWAVGSGGTILHYNGTIWSSVASGTTEDLFGVWGTSATDVWAVGSGKTFLHYNGTTWLSVSTETLWGQFGGIAYSVWGTSASDVWAVGDFGTILHYNGTTWSSVPSATMQNLISVWGSSASDVWIVGNDQMLHYIGTSYNYNGTSWRSVMAGPGLWFQAVWGSSASDVWVVGIQDFPVMNHYDGTSWSSVSIGATKNYGVWGASASDVWAVGDAGGHITGTILHYNGTTWSSVSIGTTQPLRGVWGTSSSNVWAIGFGGTILHGSPAP
jgi:hypothetical protein